MFEPIVADPNQTRAEKIGLTDRLGYFLSSMIGILAPGTQLRMDAARQMKTHLRSSNALTNELDFRSYDAATPNRFNKAN